MAGRAYMYALGAAGETGVDFVLSLFAREVRSAMAGAGVSRVSELGPELVHWRERDGYQT